jgi:O-antigen/teichoic acid export membrane protein
MSQKRKILQGSASNMARVVLSMAVALVLPPLLVHRMAPAEYSAWVLILQCSSYVNLLDLGLQTAISKFVAEYDALDDRPASSRILSSSFAILCVSALIGALGIAIVAWRVPQLFHQMPTALIGNLREGILVVGLSTVLALPFSAFSAAFTGLQKYGFPTALALIGKVSSAAVLVGLLLVHGTLVQLAWVIALFNLAAGLGQFFGWRKYAKERVDFSFELIDRESALRLAKYGSVLSIWTISVLFISGLDTVIVGHYDYKETGYYGIAASVTNFMLLIIGSLFSPLLPAASSLQTGQIPSQIGELTIRVTRYCALLICGACLPLALGAYPLLRLWLGHVYAAHSAFYLQALVLGNAIRQLGYPYSLVVAATGKQHLATIAGVAEAVVNVSVSIFLVQRIGAVGVAIGTLVGAFVGLGLHIAVSMKFTHSVISMSRRDFVSRGLLRPLLCIIPSMLLFLAWKQSNLLLLSPTRVIVWIVGTWGIAWLAGLTSAERSGLKQAFMGWYTIEKRKSDDA